MIKRFFIVFTMFATVLFLSGCSQKAEEFNKPADYWYHKMLKEIARGELETADASFTSLQSEHIRSILLPEAMLIMATAHMDSEEYTLANFYLDEYMKRYGDKKSTEFAKYMKVRSGFMGFRKPLRDQQLLIDTTKDAENFVREYPSSIYRPVVESMLVKLLLGQKQLNEDVAMLYDRLDKPEAAKKYRSDANISGLDGIKYEKAISPWYRRAFEMK